MSDSHHQEQISNIVESARPKDDSLVHAAGVVVREYLTTPEAADYLRMSESRLLRIPDIKYLRGRPNTYAKRHLDDWFDRNVEGLDGR